MVTTYLSEQPLALSANIVALMMQTIPMSIGYYDFTSNVLFLLLSGLVVIPMLCYAYKEVKVNNYLVRNGEVVTAKLHRDETKIIPLPGRTQGAVELRIQCSFFSDGVVHIFKDECTLRTSNINKIISRLKEEDTVLVCTDNSYKTYKILFQSLLHELYEDYECPRIINYILLFINIGLLLVSLLNS